MQIYFSSSNLQTFYSSINCSWKSLTQLWRTERFDFSFQYKLIADSSLCILFGREEETVDRLLWKCDILQMSRSELKMLLHLNCDNCSNFSFSEELVLFGTTANCTTDKPTELIHRSQKFMFTNVNCRVQCLSWVCFKLF